MHHPPPWLALLALPPMLACALMPAPEPAADPTPVEVTRIVVVTATAPPPPHTPAPVIQDAFTSGPSAWTPSGDPPAVAPRVEDGRLLVTVTDPALPIWLIHTQAERLPAFSLELTAEPEPGASEAYAGVLARWQVSGAHLAFLISADGDVSVQRNTGADYEDVVPWIPLPAARRPDDPRHLRLIDDGTMLSFYVDEALIITMPAGELTPGWLALIAGAWGQDGAVWAFDDVAVLAAGG